MTTDLTELRAFAEDAAVAPPVPLWAVPRRSTMGLTPVTSNRTGGRPVDVACWIVAGLLGPVPVAVAARPATVWP